MIRTYEAVIDETGIVRLLEDVSLPGPRRALVTVLDEEAEPTSMESSLLSQSALAVDWDRPEEDEAWSHLAQLPSLQ